VALGVQGQEARFWGLHEVFAGMAEWEVGDLHSVQCEARAPLDHRTSLARLLRLSGIRAGGWGFGTRYPADQGRASAPSCWIGRNCCSTGSGGYWQGRNRGRDPVHRSRRRRRGEEDDCLFGLPGVDACGKSSLRSGSG